MQRVIVLVVSLLLAACSTAPEQADEFIAPRDIVFTTALSADLEPVDRVQNVALGSGRVYLYIRWQLPRTEHVQVTRIVDGAGRLVTQREDIFAPNATNPTPSTWVWYDFNPRTDAAGRWKFEVYLNGRKMVEEYLDVLAQGPTSPPPA